MYIISEIKIIYFNKISALFWKRKWQPTPVFLPGESQGRVCLVGCRLWGRRVGHDWSDLAAAAASLFLSFKKPLKSEAKNPAFQ